MNNDPFADNLSDDSKIEKKISDLENCADSYIEQAIKILVDYSTKYPSLKAKIERALGNLTARKNALVNRPGLRR